MRIGAQVMLYGDYAPSLLLTIPGGRLEIGDRTHIHYGADIAAAQLIRIGSDAYIGSNFIAFDSDFHTPGDLLRAPEARPILIGDSAWIGKRCLVLPGVSIGAGAVIGAGSVVTRDVAAGTIAAGNPARALRSLAATE